MVDIQHQVYRFCRRITLFFMPDVKTNDNAHARLHVIVEGVVQGVNFRYHTRRVARSLLLTGWVRNRPDGCVEVLAEGARESLAHLLAFLRKGPPSARVDRATPAWLHYTGEFDAFEITS
jgi:acylphosphatase